jgi:YbbR domain-containing protein
MISFLQDLILKDFWLKLFSFALACLIWFTINTIAIKNDISPVTTFSLAPTEQKVLADLPIVVLSPASELAGCTVNPTTATVTLQGEAAYLRAVRRQDVRVMVDLSGVNPSANGRRRVEVTAPAGAVPVRVDPEDVQILNVTNN